MKSPITNSTLSNKRSGVFVSQTALVLSVAVFLMPFAILAPHAEAATKSWHRRSGKTNTRTTQTVVAATAAVQPTIAVATPAPIASTGSLLIGPKLPTSGTLCMNYGYQPTSNGHYDMSQVDSNFAKLKAAGITCLRLGYRGVDNPDSQALALRAKAAGIAVIMGGDWEMLGEGEFDAYDANAIKGAKWAEANGIPQISIGNEQEYELDGISQDEWVAHLHQLADKVHQVYSGKVSYETSSDFLPVWIRNGLGSIDLIGLNSYCGVSCNSTRIAQAIKAFGVGHVYVSEINSDLEVPSLKSDEAHAADVTKNLMTLLKTYPIPMYYFNFSSGGIASGIWGLYNGNTLVQPLTAAALGFK